MKMVTPGLGVTLRHRQDASRFNFVDPAYYQKHRTVFDANWRSVPHAEYEAWEAKQIAATGASKHRVAPKSPVTSRLAALESRLGLSSPKSPVSAPAPSKLPATAAEAIARGVSNDVLHKMQDVGLIPTNVREAWWQCPNELHELQRRGLLPW